MLNMCTIYSRSRFHHNIFLFYTVSYRDEEDELLQLAIQQSLAQSESESGNAVFNQEEDDMAR